MAINSRLHHQEQHNQPVLIFGATGQQGGSVAAAMRQLGRSVRALVRNPDSPSARDLAARGVDLFRGSFSDPASMQAAMVGIHSVFSVQPNSGSPNSGITDEDEVRFGKSVVDLAVEAGVQHLVYSSASILGRGPTGLQNLDCKLEVEDHLRSSDVPSTIIRPSTFMELLTLPKMGLDEGTLWFFMRPEQPVEFIASKDIGNITATILNNTERYTGRTIPIAADELTGFQIEEVMSKVAKQPITYRRFPDALLEENLFLRQNVALFDEGRGAGNADIVALTDEFGPLLTFEDWLNGTGHARLRSALAPGGQDIRF